MNKLIKLISSIFIVIITTIMFASISSVNAANAGPIYLGIVSLRNGGYGYKQTGAKVWKIAEYDSLTDKTADLNKTIYCIKGGPGFGSSDMATGGVPKISQYSEKFNLKDLASIESPYKEVLPTGSNYNSLMWLLDNIYIMPHIGVDNTEARNAFLKEKITDQYFYELITDDDIDTVQQLAVWYFTNPEASDKYHYETTNFTVNSIPNVDDNYVAIADLPEYSGNKEQNGWDREEAIEALFQYYVKTAKEHSDYVSPNETTKPIEIIKDNAKMQKIGNNYVAGPYRINQLLNVNYTINATYTDTENKPINPILGIKDSNNNIVETNKTIKELVGTEFYLMMPISSNISGINMTINSSYTSRTADYWAVTDAPSTEQPVVIVDETPHNFSDTVSIVVPKPFDLSLRKFITGVNGKEIANREPIVDINKLAKGEATTATYNHPKTPVRVSIGDEVIYTIRVYNEGNIDGYVEEITDHLPEQLELIVDDKLNVDYGWRLASSSDLRTVKTKYLSKANETVEGTNKIIAFDGKTLSYKDLKIKCKVVSTDPMPNKITNIADITSFTDGNGNKVVDRDSQENNVTLPVGAELENYKDAEINRGEQYIPGQQDDDDFEKLTLKSFDLSLRKFITSVNGTNITNREPKVDVSKLASGEVTTATYKHPKTPVSISIGDIVVYTIRVYNEGEMDGYIQQITDHLPGQLEFLPESEINKKYGWTIDADNSKIIRTEYLSKEKEASEGDNKIVAFNGTTLAYKDVQVECKVVLTDPMPTKITNIADISKFTDGSGNIVTDRDSQENNVQIPENLPEYKDAEIGKDYVPGQQDDDDFEKLVLKEFDLALRKFITKINDEDITNRIPQVDTSKLAQGTETTAIYNHPKTPISVEVGNIVEYTIRVYNEGGVDGYAEEITDHLPEQLEFLPDHATNKSYGWTIDTKNQKIIRTNYLSKEKEKTEGENKIVAFDGTTLSYKEVKVACKVIKTEPMPNKITNIADISKFTDGNGNIVLDRDSQENNVQIPADLPGYKDNEIGKNYVPGQQDDDDFEKLILKEFDLALRKFITKVNGTDIVSRIPQVDTTPLKTGTGTTAIYNHSKEPIKVSIGSIVEYTIRVYNEGGVDGYVGEITDHLPEQLEFLQEHETNKKFGWIVDANNSKTIRTEYFSKKNEKTEGENKLPAFDGTTLSYKEVKVACKVVKTDPMPSKITNLADISKFTDDKGNQIIDRDSQENNVQIPEDLPGYKDDEINKEYVPGQQDDDDFEKISIVKFDLALRKFITAVNTTPIKDRQPQVDTTPIKDGTGTTAIYNHPKDPVLVSNGNIVTYTIRVYNEGEMDGYAQKVKDDIPEGLKFLPEHETNIEYRWIMLDEQGNQTTDMKKAKALVTDYLSKEQEKNVGDNLIKAFEPETDTLSYKDVKVAFEVIEPNTSDRIVINKAQVSEDSDKDGNEVEDEDSTPDKWNEGEDDQDIEKIKVQYFDLSLRKWVTHAIVTIDGKDQIIETGHKAEDDPEEVVKVDLKKNQINKVTVKFKYKIRVKNEGNIAGYAKEVKDYIPDGLKFVAEDNPLWKQIDEKTIVTDQTKDILLHPGDTTEVEVTLRWINNSENFGVMDNWAEISKDDNDFDSPDIDSTPDNNKRGEDDIDDAPVIVTVKTGQIVIYGVITMAVLIIISSGIILIKKYVL